MQARRLGRNRPVAAAAQARRLKHLLLRLPLPRLPLLKLPQRLRNNYLPRDTEARILMIRAFFVYIRQKVIDG